MYELISRISATRSIALMDTDVFYKPQNSRVKKLCYHFYKITLRTEAPLLNRMVIYLEPLSLVFPFFLVVFMVNLFFTSDALGK